MSNDFYVISKAFFPGFFGMTSQVGIETIIINMLPISQKVKAIRQWNLVTS